MGAAAMLERAPAPSFRSLRRVSSGFIEASSEVPGSYTRYGGVGAVDVDARGVRAPGGESFGGGGRFQGLALPDDLTRKLLLLRLAIVVPAPSDPEKTKELAALQTGMESAYGRGKYCPGHLSGECWDLPAMEKILAESRDPKILLDVWQGWHKVAVPLRKDYIRYVELGNEGARELGFTDLGAMWRSKYDMPPDELAKELDRLWEQVKPLYVSLHAYVRRRLVETFGNDLVPPNGPTPAHLLGNMWAPQRGNVYPLVV